MYPTSWHAQILYCNSKRPTFPDALLFTKFAHTHTQHPYGQHHVVTPYARFKDRSNLSLLPVHYVRFKEQSNLCLSVCSEPFEAPSLQQQQLFFSTHESVWIFNWTFFSSPPPFGAIVFQLESLGATLLLLLLIPSQRSQPHLFFLRAAWNLSLVLHAYTPQPPNHARVYTKPPRTHIIYILCIRTGHQGYACTLKSFDVCRTYFLGLCILYP